ncbi:MAG: hypothetical protein U5L00_00585 [Desulfovermiculus sp.]|nr:hypothetical protein [Desulfovermiculus sp.]
MYFRCFLAVIGLCCILGLYACQKNSQAQGHDLLTNKCVSCHSNQITCINLGKDLEYWAKTTTRMVDKGMDMTQEEQEAVNQYLAGLGPGAEAVCE